MRNKQDYRIAETLTEFLQSNNVIIYDENNPQKIRQQGKGKEIKKAAIQHLSKKKVFLSAGRAACRATPDTLD